MPTRAAHPCNHPGCSAVTRARFCPEHTTRYDQRRPSARDRGYSARWDSYRASYLARHPWCVTCHRVASVVDHITPHQGNVRLFWDPKNHQPLCTSCHNRKIVTQDGGCGNPKMPRAHL